MGLGFIGFMGFQVSGLGFQRFRVRGFRVYRVFGLGIRISELTLGQSRRGMWFEVCEVKRWPKDNPVIKYKSTNQSGLILLRSCEPRIRI